MRPVEWKPMEDIFFFTRVPIKRQDIANQAEQAGYECQYTETVFQDLRVLSPETRSSWVFAEIAPDSGIVFEEKAQHKVDTYQPASAFMVSYHVISLPELVGLMKVLLMLYEGWVACDDDFDTIYDMHTIDQLNCA